MQYIIALIWCLLVVNVLEPYSEATFQANYVSEDGLTFPLGEI